MTILETTVQRLELPDLDTITRIFIFIGLTCLMLYVPLLNKCFLIATVLAVNTQIWRAEWPGLFKNKIIISTFALIILFTIGITYGPASWHYSLRAWDKYLKVAYLLFFLPLFVDKNSRNLAIYCFLASVMLSEVLTYLHYFNIVTFGIPASKHWLFVQDIDSGYIVSFAAYTFACLSLRRASRKSCHPEPKSCHPERSEGSLTLWRLIFILCFLICSIDVLLLNQERTGYLIYLALAGLFFLQRFKWQGLLSAALMVPLLFGGLYLVSPKFNDRVNQIFTNVGDYRQGNPNTSIGLRLAFAEYSFKVIKVNPLLGIGTGSFNETYRVLNGPKLDDSTWPSHPHNEYIAFLFQWGAIGLLLFLSWLYLHFKASFDLPREEKFLLQGLILGFVLLGLCNASLLVNPAGSCYVVLLAILLAAKKESSANVKKTIS